MQRLKRQSKHPGELQILSLVVDKKHSTRTVLYISKHRFALVKLTVKWERTSSISLPFLDPCINL